MEQVIERPLLLIAGHGERGGAGDNARLASIAGKEGNPNGSAIRFMVDGASPPDLAAYERGVFMFDGHDAEQLAHARTQWKACKAGGHDVTYWQQTPDKRWERKA